MMNLYSSRISSNNSNNNSSNNSNNNSGSTLSLSVQHGCEDTVEVKAKDKKEGNYSLV